MQHTAMLILQIREKYGLPLRRAMEIVYNSDTFRLLSDPETGEYREGSLYVLESLLGELRTGKVPEEY